MHIAILTGQFPPDVVGGAELQAQTWAERLSVRHQVTVVTRRTRRSHRVVEDRGAYRVLRVRPPRIPILRSLVDLAGISRAVGSLEPRPDILLCFITFMSGLAGVIVGRRFGIPSVVWIRGEAEYRLEDSLRDRIISPWVWRRSDGVLVQSAHNAEELLAALDRHVPKARVEVEAKLGVVPNGLDLPVEPLVPGSRVLTVGRLIADKGMEVVIEACARVGLPLTIAGDGPERREMELRARQLGGDVRFAGALSRAELEPLYRSAEIFVLASRRGEGLPNTVLEAMSYARPVVVTRTGATTDVVQDRVSGLVVEPGDIPALVEALAFLHREPQVAAELGANARRAAMGYAWHLVEPRLEAALERWRRA
jgi:glycosyltransferase involved in cell wall biosynthesis